MDVSLRPVAPPDLPELLRLCEEHALYERASYTISDQQSRLGAALFRPEPILWGWVVDAQSELGGYMTATRDFATWSARPFVHMDCLFLRECYRGRGHARGLMRLLIDFARAQGCAEIQWQTPPDNALGIAFYERLGARSKEKKRYVLTLDEQADCRPGSVAARLDAAL